MDLTKVINSSLNEISLKAFLDAIEYRPAKTKEELEKAYSLVYKEYIKRGYAADSASKLRISIHNALPQTTTFIGIVEKEIISTATVVADSPLGMPMEDIYHEELEKFRKDNKKICEISMLASDTELFRNGVSLMLHSKKLFFIFSLFKIVLDYARDILNVDYLCIAINPKHSLIYDFLLFKDFGGLKTYTNANGAPAVSKLLEVKKAEEECRKQGREGLYKMFFTDQTPLSVLSSKAIFTPQDLKYFFVEKTDVFKKAKPSQLKYIKECYPAYNFSEIIP